MNINNIQRLIDILNDSPGVTELAVTSPDGAKIAVRRSACAPPAEPPAPRPLGGLYEEDGEVDTPTELAVPSAPRVHTIPATMVGIFHAANPPLARGAAVSIGQIVGYIESMKLMNEVVAGHSGVVADVLIDENLPVEYGQPLLRLSTRDEEDTA